MSAIPVFLTLKLCKISSVCSCESGRLDSLDSSTSSTSHTMPRSNPVPRNQNNPYSLGSRRATPAPTPPPPVSSGLPPVLCSFPEDSSAECEGAPNPRVTPSHPATGNQRTDRDSWRGTSPSRIIRPQELKKSPFENIIRQSQLHPTSNSSIPSATTVTAESTTTASSPMASSNECSAPLSKNRVEALPGFDKWVESFGGYNPRPSQCLPISTPNTQAVDLSPAPNQHLPNIVSHSEKRAGASGSLGQPLVKNHGAGSTGFFKKSAGGTYFRSRAKAYLPKGNYSKSENFCQTPTGIGNHPSAANFGQVSTSSSAQSFGRVDAPQAFGNAVNAMLGQSRSVAGNYIPSPSTTNNAQGTFEQMQHGSVCRSGVAGNLMQVNPGNFQQKQHAGNSGHPFDGNMGHSDENRIGVASSANNFTLPLNGSFGNFLAPSAAAGHNRPNPAYVPPAYPHPTPPGPETFRGLNRRVTEETKLRLDDLEANYVKLRDTVMNRYGAVITPLGFLQALCGRMQVNIHSEIFRFDHGNNDVQFRTEMYVGGFCGVAHGVSVAFSKQLAAIHILDRMRMLVSGIDQTKCAIFPGSRFTKVSDKLRDLCKKYQLGEAQMRFKDNWQANNRGRFRSPGVGWKDLDTVRWECSCLVKKYQAIVQSDNQYLGGCLAQKEMYMNFVKPLEIPVVQVEDYYGIGEDCPKLKDIHCTLLLHRPSQRKLKWMEENQVPESQIDAVLHDGGPTPVAKKNYLKALEEAVEWFQTVNRGRTGHGMRLRWHGQNNTEPRQQETANRDVEMNAEKQKEGELLGKMEVQDEDTEAAADAEVEEIFHDAQMEI